MRYTVVWSASAERDLAALWTNSSARDSITQAARSIDVRLAASPDDAGESREEGRRILIVRPLAVTFVVRTDDRLVNVLDVWKVTGE